MKKLLGTVAGLAFVLALPASTAWAQYPAANSIIIDDNTVVLGQTVTGTACCFQGPVNWIVQSTPRSVGSSFPNAQGIATITFVIPSDLDNGVHTLSASGFDLNGQPLTVTTTFTVAAAGGLTPTGSNTIPWLLIGLGSVAVGGTLVGVSKRRTAKI
ncbi:MAG TPA: hypothetical protein VGB64_00035 [Actinomycetota bacterium]